MMSSRRVRMILRTTLSLSLAAVGSASCGSGADTGADAGVEPDVVEPTACDTDPCRCYLDGITPADPADSIELRRLLPEDGKPYSIVDSVGTKCGTASDKAACKAAVAAATSDNAFVLGEPLTPGGVGPLIFVVNRGDDVEVVDTAKGVTPLLAPIDTPREAVLIALLAGYSVSCQDWEGGVHAVQSGFEVPATKYTSTCFPVVDTRFVLDVTAAGDITEIQSEVIEYEAGWCI